MSTVFSSIKSWLSSGGQTSKVRGNHNQVHQTINNHIYNGDPAEISKLLNQNPSLPAGLEQHPNISLEIAGDDGTEEFRLISQYRNIANDGDSSTALRLLKELKTDDRFVGGFAAFRLCFNIGIVLQSIGEYEDAIVELRLASTFCPEHPKAKAGLALADLIDGKDESALQQANGLLSVEGDHVNLCASIAFNAAKRLKIEFDIDQYPLVDKSDEDLMIARLDYLESVHLSSFEEKLGEAMSAHPGSRRLSIAWAHSVLRNANENRTFLMGGKVGGTFEADVSKSASILLSELERSIRENPPNKLTLPFEANNAAVALRLAGRVEEAAAMLDRVIVSFPEVKEDLGQIRAAIYLQNDQETEAFKLIDPMTDKPDLQIMASEIEAQLGNLDQALKRINKTLSDTIPSELRLSALVVKARIGIHKQDRDAADEAIEELQSDYDDTSELVLIKSAYSRIFQLHGLGEIKQETLTEFDERVPLEPALLESLLETEGKDFLDIFQAANELANRGYFRQSCDLLQERVSWTRESPALELLCDSCVRGGLATLASEIYGSFSETLRNSAFGWKFGANTFFLTGEISKAVPLTRKVFNENPKSLSALQWYVQSLLRLNDEVRIRRVVKSLDDSGMSGTIAERQEYVNLLIFAREIERSRALAYQLFCEHQHDHRAWMAVSAAVLALGTRPMAEDDLWLESVIVDAAVEVLSPSGETRKFIIEADDRLSPLRPENITPDHLIAKAILGLAEGDEFEWPIGAHGRTAKVSQIKHKALDAFHFVMNRFEEKFPEATGFSSVSCDPTKKDGLDEVMELLRQRSLFAEKMIEEYRIGIRPLALLGVSLGLDIIDTFLGISRETEASVKVSTCLIEDQESASALLKRARKSGLMLDALAIYLLRRLEIADDVVAFFGKLGITQHTVDTFGSRVREARTMGGYDPDGKRVAGSMAVRDGQIVMSEMSEEEILQKVELLQSDLDWINAQCVILPATARTDPPDEVIRARNSPGGGFLDDLFASDGSGRLLVSEDLHLRQMGQTFFGTEAVWIQALLFNLEEAGALSSKSVVTATIRLLEAGEHALSVSSYRILVGAEMLSSDELTQDEFDLLCSVMGQSGADLVSHIDVAADAINGLWSTISTLSVRHRGTSSILRSLVRLQGSDSAVILDVIQSRLKRRDTMEYLKKWKSGHFIKHSTQKAA